MPFTPDEGSQPNPCRKGRGMGPNGSPPPFKQTAAGPAPFPAPCWALTSVGRGLPGKQGLLFHRRVLKLQCLDKRRREGAPGLRVSCNSPPPAPTFTPIPSALQEPRPPAWSPLPSHLPPSGPLQNYTPCSGREESLWFPCCCLLIASSPGCGPGRCLGDDLSPSSPPAAKVPET